MTPEVRNSLHTQSGHDPDPLAIEMDLVVVALCLLFCTLGCSSGKFADITSKRLDPRRNSTSIPATRIAFAPRVPAA